MTTIDALTRLGEMLKVMPRAKARFDGSGREPSRNDALTLADPGIDKKVAMVARP